MPIVAEFEKLRDESHLIAKTFKEERGEGGAAYLSEEEEGLFDRIEGLLAELRGGEELEPVWLSWDEPLRERFARACRKYLEAGSIPDDAPREARALCQIHRLLKALVPISIPLHVVRAKRFVERAMLDPEPFLDVTLAVYLPELKRAVSRSRGRVFRAMGLTRAGVLVNALAALAWSEKVQGAMKAAQAFVYSKFPDVVYEFPDFADVFAEGYGAAFRLFTWLKKITPEEVEEAISVESKLSGLVVEAVEANDIVERGDPIAVLEGGKRISVEQEGVWVVLKCYLKPNRRVSRGQLVAKLGSTSAPVLRAADWLENFATVQSYVEQAVQNARALEWLAS